VDLARLRAGELLAGAAGLLLVLSLFLDWFSTSEEAAVAEAEAVELKASAWTQFAVTDILFLLVGLAGIGLAVVTVARRAPALPVAAAVITTAVGILAVLLWLYRVSLNEPGPNELVEIDPGAWIGLLAIVGVAAGGWLTMADERTRATPPPTDVEVRPAPPRGLEPQPPASDPA